MPRLQFEEDLGDINQKDVNGFLIPSHCPSCHAEKLFQPSLLLLASNICYHVICDDCVKRYFGTGTGKCPVCFREQSRGNFFKPQYFDLRVEKELNVRKYVMSIMNKKYDDPSFEGDLNLYDNYLETIENIVYNLSNDIDVAKTQTIIEGYKKQNRNYKVPKRQNTEESQLLDDSDNLHNHGVQKEQHKKSRLSKSSKNDDTLDIWLLPNISDSASILEIPSDHQIREFLELRENNLPFIYDLRFLSGGLTLHNLANQYLTCSSNTLPGIDNFIKLLFQA